MAETLAPSPSTAAPGARPSPRASVTLYDRTSGLGMVGRYLLLAVITFVVLFPVYATVVGPSSPARRCSSTASCRRR
jgi:hypothetical protein